jgi:CRP/FNR family cyclic AMP-dependent transcriptional regulator
VLKRRADNELGRIYTPGEAIVSQGDEGDAMFVIQAGEVEVVREMDGREVGLGTMGPGDFFGEMALFQGDVRTATVRAVTEVRALTIDRRALLRRLDQDPHLAFKLVESMADRIRELHDRLRIALGEHQP